MLDFMQNIRKNVFFEIFKSTFWDILKKHWLMSFTENSKQTSR